ncbi:MAG: amylo-alpha-1,6-glucosidase [Sphingomicrobium sp.]
MRLGAMANLKEVPHHPSYSSSDSTPLFLVLIGRHVEWTRSLALFDELRPAIDAALTWMATDGDSDGDGYLDYSGANENGLINQGWKDSGAGIPRHDGSTPEGPIALCEIQGYAYLARKLISRALDLRGEVAAAKDLDRDAEALRIRFNRDFWMEDEGCFALALEAGGRQVTTVTSNAGQVLWAGIADPDKADRNARRMMRLDMNSGWGIRTLSDREAAYNPLNYHLGSVWPFDTALIMVGMVDAGLSSSAVELFDAVIAASSYFSLGRLPEFYVGHAREADVSPSRCPFAEPMQAWSAGAAPYMLSALLGLRSGTDGLEIVDPHLPGGVDRLHVRGLTIGTEGYHCEFIRNAEGAVSGRIVSRKEIDA